MNNGRTVFSQLPDFAQTLIAVARPLHAHDPIGVELNQSLHALD